MKLLIALEKESFSYVAETKKHKLFLLKEMGELIDDEETMVKIKALWQLVDMLPLYTE